MSELTARELRRVERIKSALAYEENLLAAELEDDDDESDDDELHDLYDGAIDPEAYEGDHHRKRPAGVAGAARDDPHSGGEHDDSGGIVDDADYMAWAWQRRVASDRHSLEASRGELAASAKQKWRRLRHVRKAAARATGASGFFSGKDQAGDAARLAR